MPLSIENGEEMCAVFKVTGSGKYVYQIEANAAEDKARGFYIKWNRKPEAAFHTHTYFAEGHLNNSFSSPGNSANKTGDNDLTFVRTTGIPLAMAAPTGEVKVLYPRTEQVETLGYIDPDPRCELYMHLEKNKRTAELGIQTRTFGEYKVEQMYRDLLGDDWREELKK